MAEKAYLPETPEELTPGWLSEALGVDVASVQLEVLDGDQGFMGDVVRLALESPDSPLPSHLVAKLPKKANRVVGELLGVYEREIMFFSAFSNDFPVRIPKLYFSEFDRDKGSEKQREIIRWLDGLPAFMAWLIGWAAYRIAGAKRRRYLLLIEYFDGMQAGDQVLGLDAQRCQQVLESIAPMHAKYWAHPTLGEHFWLQEFDIDARMRQGTFRKHQKRYASVLDVGLTPHLDWLGANGEQLLRRFYADAPSTLLHCDLRLDNVLFDGADCAFIDFQMMRSGPAAYDVAYFISSALREDATTQQREAVLQGYHQALAAPDYCYDNFRRDYERALMAVLSVLSGTDEVQLGDTRGQTMMAAWLRRLHACLQSVNPATLLD